MDYKEKTHFGIACSGFKNATSHPLYFRWVNMIRRCYDKNVRAYRSYGGKGVFVSDELLDFENYVSIVEKLENYSCLLENPNDWDIDKDLRSVVKRYARETLTVMRKHKNIELENSYKKIKVQQFSENGNLLNTFESICNAEENTGIPKGNIARSIRNKKWKAGGYVWRNYYDTRV